MNQTACISPSPVQDSVALKGPRAFSCSNFFQKTRSGVERGADGNVLERVTQSYGYYFFSVLYRLRHNEMNYEKPKNFISQQ